MIGKAVLSRSYRRVFVVTHLGEHEAVISFEQGCFQIIRKHESDMVIGWAGGQDMCLVLNYRILVRKR